MKANLFIVYWLIAMAVYGMFMMACEKSPIKPTPEPAKDPRQYSWTVDTLAYPGSFQTLMERIWGSSPQNVYVVGHCNDARGDIYHFDGKTWWPFEFRGWGSLELCDIYGFSEDDIWIVGARSKLIGWDSLMNIIADVSSIIIHYNGSTWQKLLDDQGEILLTVWGISPSDIWAGGIHGNLFHYNGHLWQPDSVPLRIPRDPQAVWIFNNFAGNAADNIYSLLTARNKQGQEWYYLLRHNGTAWSIVDSMKYTYFSRLWMSPSGTLYATGSGVKRRDGTSWTALLQHAFTVGIHGTSDENIFVASNDGEIFHYNGLDWYRFENLQFPGTGFWDIWTDGREVFIVGNTTLADKQVTLILHGK